MSDLWDLGPVDELPEGAPCLQRGPNGQRLACIRRGERVDVLDDRCPHEGYPLSQGSLREGVLTCRWHNWKFETATGACTFGGEPVRRYPAHVDGRRHLVVDGTIDLVAERARVAASLRDGMRQANAAQCARDALRLAALAGEAGASAAFETMLGDALARERYGFDHPEACVIDLASWVARGWLAADDAVPAAVTLIAEPLQFLPELPRAPRVQTGWGSAADLARALTEERREEAEGRARFLGAADAERAVAAGLLPFLRRGLYDYGHGAIFAGKALEIARAFPALGEEAVAALTRALAWATLETGLPPWSATREAVARSTMVDRVGSSRLEGPAREAFEAGVLTGEKEAVQATLEAIVRGHDVAEVLVAIGHAAVVRLGRFDLAWTRRTDAAVGFLDVTHAATTARALRELWAVAPRAENVALAVLAAGFVGKLRKADDPAAREPDAFVGDARPARLVDAVRAREPERARAMAARFDRPARLESYRALAPFAALEAAVRPILLAHTIKVTEALHRMESEDPRESGAYLDALVRYLATPVPERAFTRTGTIARQFLTDGRPPPGLY